MLIGHLGFAMGLKAWAGSATRREPGGSEAAMPGYGLAPWFGAVLFSDLACFAFSLVGIETFRFEPGFVRHFPYRLVHGSYTHSFVGAALLGAVVASIWWLARGRKSGMILPALALAVGVFSHVPFDVIVHGPDMAWAFEPPSLGFSLWNHPEFSESLEVLLLAAGTYVLLRAYPRVMHWRFKAMLGILLVAQVVPYLAPPIPNPTIAAISGFSSMFGLVLVGWWGGRVPEHA